MSKAKREDQINKHSECNSISNSWEVTSTKEKEQIKTINAF
jgi:hypothetical protein